MKSRGAKSGERTRYHGVAEAQRAPKCDGWRCHSARPNLQLAGPTTPRRTPTDARSTGGVARALAEPAKASPDPVAVLRGHTVDVTTLAFSDTLLASGDADGHLKLWDLELRRAVSRRLCTTGMLAVFWAPGGNDVLMTQTRNGLVNFWQLADGRELSREPVLSVATGSFGFCRCAVLPRCCADADSQSTESAADTCDAAYVRRPAGESSPRVGDDTAETSAALHSFQLLVTPAEETSIVQAWDPNTGPSGSVLTLRMPDEAGPSRNSNIVGGCGMCMSLQAAGYEDGTVALWDLRAPSVPLKFERLHTEAVVAMAADLTGTSGVSVDANGHVIHVTWGDSPPHVRAAHAYSLSRGAGDVAIRRDRRLLAVAGWDQRVHVYDYKKRRPLARLKYHMGSVGCVAFSSDGALLASGAKDANIALWSLYPK